VLSELYSLTELASMVGGRIDALWGFFISIHLAILGGIVYVDRPLSIVEKSVALLLYFGFAVASYYALSVQQDLFNANIQQIASYKNSPCCEENALTHFYANMLDSNYRDKARIVALIAHIVATLVIVGSIVSDKLRTQSQTQKGE